MSSQLLSWLGYKKPRGPHHGMDAPPSAAVSVELAGVRPIKEGLELCTTLPRPPQPRSSRSSSSGGDGGRQLSSAGEAGSQEQQQQHYVAPSPLAGQQLTPCSASNGADGSNGAAPMAGGAQAASSLDAAATPAASAAPPNAHEGRAGAADAACMDSEALAATTEIEAAPVIEAEAASAACADDAVEQSPLHSDADEAEPASGTPASSTGVESADGGTSFADTERAPGLACAASGAAGDAAAGDAAAGDAAAAAALTARNGSGTSTPRCSSGGGTPRRRSHASRSSWAGDADTIMWLGRGEEGLEDDPSISREERMLRLWLNSLGTPTRCSSLFGAEVRTGWLLLEVVDLLQPGSVDWRMTNRPPFKDVVAELKSLENVQAALAAAQQHLGLALVSMSARDIVGGKRKIILALVYQLMRFHTLQLLSSIAGGSCMAAGGEVGDSSGGGAGDVTCAGPRISSDDGGGTGEAAAAAAAATGSGVQPAGAVGAFLSLQERSHSCGGATGAPSFGTYNGLSRLRTVSSAGGAGVGPGSVGPGSASGTPTAAAAAAAAAGAAGSKQRRSLVFGSSSKKQRPQLRISEDDILAWANARLAAHHAQLLEECNPLAGVFAAAAGSATAVAAAVAAAGESAAMQAAAVVGDSSAAEAAEAGLSQQQHASASSMHGHEAVQEEGDGEVASGDWSPSPSPPPPPPPPRIRSFRDPSLAAGHSLLRLLAAIDPAAVDLAHATPGATPQQREANARYCLAAAQAMGCSIFLLPEDILEVNARALLVLLALLMAADQQRQAQRQQQALHEHLEAAAATEAAAVMEAAAGAAAGP